MSRGISRRRFFFGTLLAGVIPRGGFGSVPSLKALGYQSPNERMNIGAVGAGGRALGVLGALDSENIVAFADVDWARGAEGFKRWDKAARYKDYRQMLDKEQSIDAVTVVIPDHMHTHVALAAMQRGKHVYVEKPLTRTPWEARLLTEAAARYKVATQMGNQGYSHEATRVAAEIIWSGEIGDVTEVHSFRGRASWPQGMKTLPAPEPVPDTLDWDLWLGPAAFRPYTSGDEAYRTEYARQQFGFYLPFNWRGFYDFGTSLIGDWGIHQLGPANLALRLGSPASVECLRKGEGESPYTFPRGGTVVRWDFFARENMPPVAVYWSDTGDMYAPPGMSVEEMRQISGTGPQIEGVGDGRGRGGPSAGGGRGRGGRGGQGGLPQGSGYNTVFVGSKGYLGTSGRGEGVGLIPGTRWAEYQLPPRMLTRSPGHQRDWVRACKGGEPACSHFGIAGPYTEWMVLGAIAARVEGKLLWDPKRMEFTNSRDANRYIKPHFRKGWEIRAIT
ncbi:MAG TPA: Gfo/Idh/MocA family oxidoreductase [Vicinamibacterales bacterium]|nr:Gfo/Idh/MocA family oxidoreductase [Vicinamibacterales bacterium]